MQVSGDTAVVNISDIIIERDSRVRKSLDEKRLSDLADSIRRLGLIHFPVLRRDMVLIAGETRIEACRLLGWDKITVQWSDTLTEHEHLELELEENIKRTDLPWQDQCDAMKRYHELKLQTEASWSMERTAESIGVSLGTVSSYLQVAKEIAAGNERVTAAPRLSTAKGIVRRKLERAASDELHAITEIAAPVSPILNADFSEWVQTYEGPPFTFLHCDFPYGINVDKHKQSAGSRFGSYEDSFEIYTKLLDVLDEHKNKLLGDSAHILFWFSMKHYQYTLERLQKNFWVDPYPLVWHKSDNKGTLPDPERGPRRSYEVAFLCSHGDRKIIAPVSNVNSCPTSVTTGHATEKPEQMLHHFFRMIVDTNTRILDPTCGSGSALRAARTLGAKSILGLEINPEFALNAQRSWRAE